MSLARRQWWWVLSAFWLLCSSALAQDVAPAGEVAALIGKAWVELSSGEQRALSKGDQVFSGEQIGTGERTLLRLRFTDDTETTLASNTRFKIDDYAFGTAKDAIQTSVLKGAFRIVSGKIAKREPSAMRVRTVVAVIGIRGTHFAGEVEGTSARIMLMTPEEEHPTAIEVSNEFGSVVIDEPGFGTEIPDEFSPPSPPRRMQLRAVNNLMRSLQSIQRLSVPRPRFR